MMPNEPCSVSSHMRNISKANNTMRASTTEGSASMEILSAAVALVAQAPAVAGYPQAALLEALHMRIQQQKIRMQNKHGT